MPIQIDPLIARYADEFEAKAQGKPWINSHSAKGYHVVEWRSGKPWYWFDSKTEGYPQKGFVGKLVLRGGNWRRKEDLTPLDVYRKDVALDETAAATPAGSIVARSILERTFPLADYLEISTLEAHGNGAMREIFPFTDGTYYGMTSVFMTLIDGDTLVENIRRRDPSFNPTPENLRAELKQISRQSDVCLVTTEQCIAGDVPEGAWGDDQKFAELLRGLGIEPKTPILPGVECHRLSSSPATPFSERQETRYYRTKPKPDGEPPKEATFR